MSVAEHVEHAIHGATSIAFEQAARRVRRAIELSRLAGTPPSHEMLDRLACDFEAMAAQWKPKAKEQG